jgi:hypothetical protein
LYVLLLRTYKLAQEQIIEYRPEYGGCKSWIDVAEPISLDGMQPVLDDAEYTRRVAEIRAIVDNEQLTVV